MILDGFREYSQKAQELSILRDVMSQQGGAYIRTWREREKVSIRKLAPRLGVTPSYLSKVERGKETILPELAQHFYDLVIGRNAEGL
jgi:predicted transcriptional regulator